MAINCGPSCLTCHLIDANIRCPPHTTCKPSLRPGDINKMFERIVRTAPGNRTLTETERRELLKSGMTEYSVVVHSQPGNLSATESSPELDQSLKPWLVTFENFLTPEECQGLIELGHEYKFERAMDVGFVNAAGIHEGVINDRRTAETAPCTSFNGCRQKEIPSLIHERTSKVAQLRPTFGNDLEILKYEVGQLYKIHHDYLDAQVKLRCGPRALTFFLYLSDVVGGGTDFPHLNLTIQPKRGRAVLWSNVYDSAPLQKDPRLEHEGMAVEAGTKFATHIGYYLYDYLESQAMGCV
jgi:prolyl 4-hydroxylase